MKIKDQCVTGSMHVVNNYTQEWHQVRIHPATFYRRIDQFIEGFKTVKGLYTELDLGQFVSIRFSNKQDLTDFYRMHNAYL